MISVSDYISKYQVRILGTRFLSWCPNMESELEFPYDIKAEFEFVHDLQATPPHLGEPVLLPAVEKWGWTYAVSGFTLITTVDGEPLPETISDPRTGEVWTREEAKLYSLKTSPADPHQEEAYEHYTYLRTETRKYLYRIPLERLLYEHKVDFESIEDTSLEAWLEKSEFFPGDEKATYLYNKIQRTQRVFIDTFGEEMYNALLHEVDFKGLK